VIRRMCSIAVVAVMFGGAALAQQQGTKPKQQTTQQQSQQKQMSMDDMMKGCREHCQAAMKSIDQTMKTMADAKASNDPAKMRAALDQAERPLADMRQCMSMMGMMQKMHGGMMNK
jgi:predicted HicB family RNase H-like nuclease